MPKLGRLTRSRQPMVGSVSGFVFWSNSFLGVSNIKKSKVLSAELKVRKLLVAWRVGKEAAFSLFLLAAQVFFGC